MSEWEIDGREVTSNSLWRVIEDFENGVLSESGREEFLHVLEDSRRARAVYLEYCELSALLQMKAEGKLLHSAVRMKGAPPRHGYENLRPYLEGDWDSLEAIQIWYSALTRASENSIVEAADRGKGMIVRGVVRRIDPWTSLDDFTAQNGLDDLRADGESAAQFLLRFAIASPGLHTTIIGTKSLDHLADNIRAVETGPLPADVLAEAKQRLDAKCIRVAA